MQLWNVITAFSNQTLHTPSVPTQLQKHFLLLVLWHLIPPSPLPPLGTLCASRALLQDMKVRWKMWGKQQARKHPCLWCGSPYPKTLSHPGRGEASNGAARSARHRVRDHLSSSQPTGVPVHLEQVSAVRAVFLTMYTSFTARAIPTSSTSPYNTEQILSFK